MGLRETFLLINRMMDDSEIPGFAIERDETNDVTNDLATLSNRTTSFRRLPKAFDASLTGLSLGLRKMQRTLHEEVKEDMQQHALFQQVRQGRES